MDVELIRGDTQPLKFNITDAEGNPIELASGDELIFTMKKNYNTGNVILQKRLSTGDIQYEDESYKLVLTHTDTAELKYGTYVYDMQLMSGDLVATIAMGTITLNQEVTFITNE